MALELVSLLLLSAGLGLVIGACLVRLGALKRLQRDHERWRKSLHKELNVRTVDVDKHIQLEALCNQQARTIEALQSQLQGFDSDEHDVPVLTRQIELQPPPTQTVERQSAVVEPDHSG